MRSASILAAVVVVGVVTGVMGQAQQGAPPPPLRIEPAKPSLYATVIPGHGPVATKADLQKYKNSLQTLHTRTRELIKQGVPKDQYVSRLKTDDLGWGVDPASLFVRAGAGGFYDELQASAK